MTFEERDAVHERHSRDVEAALTARGFTVEHTGFELLDQAAQDAALKEIPGGTLRRWWPDMRARRGPFGEFWVDAKSCVNSESENYSVELAALACYGIIEARLRRAVVLVWPGGRCNYSTHLTPVHVETRGGTRGSDTSYVLVRKADQLAFRDIFGDIEVVAA